MLERVPAARWIGTYDRANLRGDLLAALVITALMVPQSLGYAALAGAPVQAGLYAIPLALVVYALLGSSPQLVVGPVSTVSVLTGSIVAARGVTDPAEALAVVAAALAMVGLAESLSAARLFAVKNGYRVNADREFVATGTANIAAGFSGGIGVAGSLSKTAASDTAGGRSQVTGLAATVLVVLVVLFFAPSLSSLPRAVLSAIVIHAVWGLMDVGALRRYRKVRRNDFVGAMAALIGVLVLGTLYGLLFAVAQSVLGLVYRSVQVEVDAMGKVEGEKAAWGSLGRNPDNKTVDGILVLRLSAPLFWINATKATLLVMDEVETTDDLRAVIIDLEATNQLDTTSADALGQLVQRLHRRGIDVYLVRVMYPARRVLRRTGVTEMIGMDHMWRTISQGVKAAKQAVKDDR